MIYFALLTFFIVVVYLISIFLKNEKNNAIEIPIAFSLYCFLLIFYGLRTAESGTDTINYLSLFANLDYESRIEPLFIFFSKGINFLSGSDQLIILLLYFIPQTMIFLAVYKIYPIKKTLIIFFLITFSFSYYDLSSNIIRQFWSSSFWLLGLAFVFDKKKIGFVLIVSSIFLHYSYIIPTGILLVLMLFNRKLGNKFNYCLLIILLIMSVTTLLRIDPFSQLILSVTDSLASMASLVGASSFADIMRLINRYGYNVSTQGSFHEATIIPLVIECLTIIIPFSLYTFFCDKKQRINLIARFFALMSLFFLFAGYQSMSYRYSYMALVILPLFWGEICINLERYSRIISFVIVPIAFLYFWFRINYLPFDWVL
ncbi:hypothetical protein E2R68_05085 [Psychromonas sp. RZ22]|uniref:EpsG family protein n=1 Tax=Psychromonas algarum TaxID=2555643 RepID=UPI001068B548|nr:hypothetical protein E2R68_05085 [Psychromonas sp. RZ22]